MPNTEAQCEGAALCMRWGGKWGGDSGRQPQAGGQVQSPERRFLCPAFGGFSIEQALTSLGLVGLLGC